MGRNFRTYMGKGRSLVDLKQSQDMTFEVYVDGLLVGNANNMQDGGKLASEFIGEQYATQVQQIERRVQSRKFETKIRSDTRKDQSGNTRILPKQDPKQSGVFIAKRTNKDSTAKRRPRKSNDSSV